MTASFGPNPTPLFGILNMIILYLSITWERFAKICHDIGSRLEASRSRGHEIESQFGPKLIALVLQVFGDQSNPNFWSLFGLFWIYFYCIKNFLGIFFTSAYWSLACLVKKATVQTLLSSFKECRWTSKRATNASIKATVRRANCITGEGKNWLYDCSTSYCYNLHYTGI